MTPALLYVPNGKDPQIVGESVDVLLLEPFWGGSHRTAAEGWAAHSRHRVRVETLPARFWKWRLRGAAFEFARRLRQRPLPHVLLATSLLDLAHLKALLPTPCPCLLYFHENQAAYPDHPNQGANERDLQYAFSNLASAAAAEHVAFNSEFQRRAFLHGMARILQRMPDTRPRWLLSEIEAKSSVLPLGVDADALRPTDEKPVDVIPLVLWNHRWEHDKDPDRFFRVMLRLAERNVPFRLAVVGEQFTRVPEIFSRIRERLRERIEQWGYLRDRHVYYDLLQRAHIVVSTARQENFGLSMVEAACAGAHPLAPDDLCYPEVFPGELHESCLYRDEFDLEQKLEGLLSGSATRCGAARLHRLFARYSWPRIAEGFDDRIAQVSEIPKV